MVRLVKQRVRQWKENDGNKFNNKQKTANNDFPEYLIWEKWFQHLRTSALCVVFHSKTSLLTDEISVLNMPVIVPLKLFTNPCFSDHKEMHTHK